MNIDTITPLILTYNETPNIERTLAKLPWAQEIIVIDSFSEDSTLEILKSHPKIKIFQRKFDTHAQQWNYGLEQVKSEWVLSLDADYVLTNELIETFRERNLQHTMPWAGMAERAADIRQRRMELRKNLPNEREQPAEFALHKNLGSRCTGTSTKFAIAHPPRSKRLARAAIGQPLSRVCSLEGTSLKFK